MKHILLCGGSGSRLWPLSRTLQPKQFIHLFDNISLFQKTCLGNKDLTTETIVVCNLDHRILAQKQLAECGISQSRFIFEPEGRNTSAAIALALLTISPEDIVLVTPSDHQIEYSEKYAQAIRRAELLAKEGNIIVFGIVPSYPETGYGYIESVGENVVQFQEKPNLEVALQYLAKGNFYWNSGMLCCQAKTLLNSMKSLTPDVLHFSLQALNNAKHESTSCDEIKISIDDMNLIPSLSIDYAILEKVSDLKMVKCEFRWCDLGSFDSLFLQLQKDENGNALDVKSFHGVNAKNNLMISEDRTLTAIDVENLVVIDTKDALLISKLGSTQKVKDIVSLLKLSGSDIHKSHIDEMRPWGNFIVLETSENYKVKRIVVNPGKKISLQKHQFRHEHWTVVSGTGLVTLGDQQIVLEPNQSIYIPLGDIHRIENIGKNDLVVIEVQYGDSLREDDIIRIKDDFDRIHPKSAIIDNVAK